MATDSANTTNGTSEKSNNTPINAVIFDMDGIIFDSEKTYFDAFFIAAEQHGIEADGDFVHQFAGQSLPTCQLLLKNFFNQDLDKTQQFFHDWAVARHGILAENGLPFKSGFLNLFKTVKSTGLPIGLVTSSNRNDMEDNFKRNDSQLLNEFTHIVTLDDVEHPKPHPQPYQMMIKELNQAPEHCVVIEDSSSGANAAVSAGAKTIMLADHRQPESPLKEKLFHIAEHHDNILSFLRENGL